MHTRQRTCCTPGRNFIPGRGALTYKPRFSWSPSAQFRGRELHCIELGTDLQVLPVQWNLQSFRRLRKLRVDFDPIQSNGMLLLRFDYPRNIAAHIQELELFDISWPSPGTLQIMAQAFPGLRSLKLSQDLIWCGLCNICRFATFKDPPPPEIVYDKIVGLPVRRPSPPVVRPGLTVVSGPLPCLPQATRQSADHHVVYRIRARWHDVLDQE